MTTPAGTSRSTPQNLSKQTGTTLTDNFNADSSDVNQSTGTIQFGSHGLTTGDAVLYVDDGNLLPGMRQGCSGAPLGGCVYTAIVVDANHIQFGNTFTTTAVDASGIPGFCGTSNPDSCPGVDANREHDPLREPAQLRHRRCGHSLGRRRDRRVVRAPRSTSGCSTRTPIALYTTHAAAVDAGDQLRRERGERRRDRRRQLVQLRRAGHLRDRTGLAFNVNGVNVDPTNYSSTNTSAYDIVLGQVFASGSGQDPVRLVVLQPGRAVRRRRR